jgi:pyruvate dehydrogenase E1 component
MMETVDGEYQNCKAFGGKPTRASISSASIRKPRRWWPTLSDDDIWRLNRGGHDPHKVYAAYDGDVN